MAASVNKGFPVQYNIELVGHSFLVRLEKFMQKGKWNNLNLDNEKFVLHFSAKGGMKLQELLKICNWHADPEALRTNPGQLELPVPHVAYLEIGTNDLCQQSQSAETFARQIVSFASYLRKGFGVDCVIISQILHRHPRTSGKNNNSTCHLNRDFDITEFNNKVNITNCIIQNKIKEKQDSGIIFWRHRGFWHEARGKFHSDGVHLNPHNGLHIYARSVRGAILHAVSKLAAEQKVV